METRILPNSGLRQLKQLTSMDPRTHRNCEGQTINIYIYIYTCTYIYTHIHIHIHIHIKTVPTYPTAPKLSPPCLGHRRCRKLRRRASADHASRVLQMKLTAARTVRRHSHVSHNIYLYIYIYIYIFIYLYLYLYLLFIHININIYIYIYIHAGSLHLFVICAHFVLWHQGGVPRAAIA